MHACEVTEPASYSDILASNIRAARALRRITQSSLAVRMRELGYRWHFQTVGAVERGERRLAAEELLGLSVALETTMDNLLLPPIDGQIAVLPAGQYVVLPAGRRQPIPPGWTSLWDGDKSRLSTEPIRDGEEG